MKCMWDLKAEERELALENLQNFFDKWDKELDNYRLKIYHNFLMDSSLDIMHAIYEAIGISQMIEDDFYDKNIQEMQKYFDLDGNLLEVGCGVIPAFASRIANMQKKGSVTAYDPRLMTNVYGKIKLYQECINANYDVKKYNLIYGIFTCEASELMIKLANQNDIDLYMLLCNCNVFKIRPNRILYSSKDKLEYFKNLVKATLPFDRRLECYYQDGFDNPIIRTYKKKFY